MKFIITTSDAVTHPNITLTKFGNFSFWFDDRVSIEQTSSKLRFWFGVSWPIPLAKVNIDTIADQSGSWCYGEISETKAVVFTDLCADYPIYYSTNDNMIVSNIFNIFDPSCFTLNKKWLSDAVYMNCYHHTFHNPVDINIVNVGLLTDKESYTAINHVNKMPHCGKLEVDAYNNIQVSQYFDRSQSYKDASLLTKIDNINEYVSNKIDQNMQAIVSQNSEKKLGILASTGIDSLVILEWMINTDTNFSVSSYCFEDSPMSKQSKKNIKALHSFLQSKNIKTSYDSPCCSDFFDNFLPHTWTIPSKMDDLAQETFTASTTLGDSDYLIKGSGGDECFLHRQKFAMILVGKENNLTYQDAVAACKGHYAYQEPWPFFNETKYNQAKNSTLPLIHILCDTMSLKPYTYLSDDQVLLNKPIFSPFCDRDLLNITARMKFSDLYGSMFDAAPQQAYLKSMLPFLNQHKYGEFDIHRYTFPMTDKFIELIQTLKTELIAFDLPGGLDYNNLIAKELNYNNFTVGELVPYNVLRFAQLGAWIQNWKNGHLNL